MTFAMFPLAWVCVALSECSSKPPILLSVKVPGAEHAGLTALHVPDSGVLNATFAWAERNGVQLQPGTLLHVVEALDYAARRPFEMVPELHDSWAALRVW